LPSGTGTTCRFGSAGPIGGTAWVGGAAGAGCCCARMAVAVMSQAPPIIAPAAANAINPRRFMVSPSVREYLRQINSK